MIAIAPPELSSVITPGRTIKLQDLIARADIRDGVSSRVRREGGNQGATNNLILELQIRNRITSKYFFQNCCRVALGKCDHCRAPECTDRDWRKREYCP
jgi:hypothetical protein